MPTLLLIKLAAAGLLVATVLYFVNDYRTLQEYKHTAQVTIATKDLEIADKKRRLKDALEIATENKERAEIASKSLQKARIDAIKADANIKLTKLQRISGTTRFGKTDADGNTLLSTKMSKATEKLFNEIETLSEVHGQ